MFQRLGEPVDDGYTTLPGQFANYAAEFARVIYGSGREQRQAAQESASLPATFEVLHNPKTASLSVTDRIVFNGADWDIISVSPLGLNEGVRIVAVKAV